LERLATFAVEIEQRQTLLDRYLHPNPGPIQGGQIFTFIDTVGIDSRPPKSVYDDTNSFSVAASVVHSEEPFFIFWIPKWSVISLENPGPDY
jgi:hypothetical protein